MDPRTLRQYLLLKPRGCAFGGAQKWLPWLLPTDLNLVLSRDNSRLDTAPISIMSYGMLTSGKAKEALAQRIADAQFQVNKSLVFAVCPCSLFAICSKHGEIRLHFGLSAIPLD